MFVEIEIYNQFIYGFYVQVHIYCVDIFGN